MLMLCEEYENDDGIRSFTVLAVSEEEKMLQKLLAAKVEKDEYGFIAKSDGGDFDNPNHFVTEYIDGEGFVGYHPRRRTCCPGSSFRRCSRRRTIRRSIPIPTISVTS